MEAHGTSHAKTLVLLILGCEMVVVVTGTVTMNLTKTVQTKNSQLRLHLVATFSTVEEQLNSDGYLPAKPHSIQQHDEI